MNNLNILQDPAHRALRPREKAKFRGISTLSDSELVQLILRSGGKQSPVAGLAQKVLEVVDAKGAEIQVKDLVQIPGIGPALGGSLAASLELGRRLWTLKKGRIAKPETLWPQLLHYTDRTQERFLVICLSGAHEVLKIRVITIGLLNRTLIHPREVFAAALEEHSASIILAHNHPSGVLEPSWEDLDITNRLKQAGEIMGIPVLDHLIFSPEGYYSFVNQGTF